MIEVSVKNRHQRRARAAFFVTAGVVGLLTATVASSYWHPIVGLLFGALVGAATGLVVAVLVTVWPVLRVFWHWSVEIVLGLTLVYGWQALMAATNLALSLVLVAVLVGVPAALRPVRQRLVAWFWCVTVRHRLRLCFAAFIATNRHGTLPLILLARPTPAGERVWIWLRPGLSIKDLEAEGQVNKLAVACWAKDVRVVPASRSYAALVRVDVTRREPLTATVVSPLPGLVPADAPSMPPRVAVRPTGGLDLPDVPGSKKPADRSANTALEGRTRPRTPSGAPRPAFVSTAGDDVSDYI